MAQTALDLIKRSMRLVGALGRNETPSAEEQTDVLETLNAMLEEWWTNNLSVYRVSSTSFSWAGGETTRTIGATGDVVMSRPNELLHAFTSLNGSDTPIQLVSAEEYYAIADKTTTGTLITRLYYDPTYPSGTLYVYPVPVSAVSVQIQYLDALQAFETATEEISLPPGYKNAIVYNLAEEIAPEFQLPVPNHVATRASSTKRALRVQNSRPVFMRSEFQGERFNIYRGH